jgi:hypothetical protein
MASVVENQLEKGEIALRKRAIEEFANKMPRTLLS